MPKHTNSHFLRRKNVYYWRCRFWFVFWGGNEGEIIHTQPKNNVFYNYLLLGGISRQGKTTRGWNKERWRKPTFSPPGQDQTEKLNGAQCRAMGSSSTSGSSAAAQASSNYIQPDSQHCYVYSFVYLCVSVRGCTCVCVRTHVNEKVEKGLRRQQLAWELRGHSGRIDFINRLSQHSGSGCSRAHWRHRMWDRNRQDEQTKHICIISFWQQNRNQASQILTHTAHFSDLQTLSPLNDMILKMTDQSRCGIPQLLNEAAVHACVHCDEVENTGNVSKPLAMLPHFSHLFTSV